jgi:hypothetical protein
LNAIVLHHLTTSAEKLCTQNRINMLHVCRTSQLSAMHLMQLKAQQHQVPGNRCLALLLET